MSRLTRAAWSSGEGIPANGRPATEHSLTDMRDLRTGLPVWLAAKPGMVCKTLRGPARADVIVIGAGITGALVAEAATGAGLSHP
jgi:hypothetical protein